MKKGELTFENGFQLLPTQDENVAGRSKQVGIKRTIKVGAIAAGATTQYERNHAKLKQGVREYGAYNAINIINNDIVDVEIALDFADNKTYLVPDGAMISIDEVDYREFDITNLDAGTAVTANKIRVTVMYEAPLERERMRSYKQVGGR